MNEFGQPEFTCPACQKRRPTLGSRLRIFLGLRRRVCRACSMSMTK